MNNIFKKERNFFLFIFGLVLIFYHTAFSIRFFQDDYFFLTITKINNLQGFLNFFSPIRSISFRPIPSESFYFLLKLLNYNTFLGHVIVFITYFFGLYFFYQCIKLVGKSSLLAQIVIFLYAINFSHVFQLYWFTSFQEVVLFTALSGSFLFYLRKKFYPSLIFFIVALCSKETALFYPVFIFLFEFFLQKNYLLRKKRLQIVVFGLFSIIFYLIYRYSLARITTLENYQVQINNLRLVANNTMWYMLWAWGIPNFVPNFMRSIFAMPLPVFWDYWKQPEFRFYTLFYLASFAVFIGGLIWYLITNKKKIKTVFFATFLFGVSFYLFLGPILFFIHKWMVRLMIPSVFLAIFQGFLIFLFLKSRSKLKYLAVIYLMLYMVSSFIGIKLHESSSVYLFENKISLNAVAIFKNNKKEILKHDVIFFYDVKPKKKMSAWGHSKKLKNSLWDQYFLNYYFPEKKMKAYYNFETKTPPENSYLIDSYQLLK